MPVRISRRATRDVREIWDYTVEQWGQGQAEIYVGRIEAAVEAIALEPGLGRRCDETGRGYRRYIVGSHILFHRTAGKAVFVGRLLHQRIDIRRHS